MATIVVHTKTGARYVLLGSGYGEWATARSDRFLGDMFPKEQHGDTHLLCVCDGGGRVHWMRAEEARVVSVDGASPADALGGA
ncbi:MAG: hypothetical protein R3B57_01120 [Phycisphaerales bacterium]